MNHPPAFDLERLAVGEARGAEADALRAHVAACTACSQALESIERQRDALLDRMTPEDLVADLVAADEGGRGAPTRGWRWALAAMALVLLTAAGLWLGWPRVSAPDRLRWRGESIGLTVYVQRAGQVQPLGVRAPQPGDRLRFELHHEGERPAWAALVGLVDGRPVAVLPPGSQDRAFVVRDAGFLPGAAVLGTDQARTELLLVVRPNAFSVDQVLDELTRAEEGEAGPRIDGLVKTWLVTPEVP